jgi:hypothetical protein
MLCVSTRANRTYLARQQITQPSVVLTTDANLPDMVQLVGEGAGIGGKSASPVPCAAPQQRCRRDRWQLRRLHSAQRNYSVTSRRRAAVTNRRETNRLEQWRRLPTVVASYRNSRPSTQRWSACPEHSRCVDNRPRTVSVDEKHDLQRFMTSNSVLVSCLQTT